MDRSSAIRYPSTAIHTLSQYGHTQHHTLSQYGHTQHHTLSQYEWLATYPLELVLREPGTAIRYLSTAHRIAKGYRHTLSQHGSRIAC
eukprot:3188377-Rhodomonas_salina.1